MLEADKSKKGSRDDLSDINLYQDSYARFEKYVNEQVQHGFPHAEALYKELSKGFFGDKYKVRDIRVPAVKVSDSYKVGEPTDEARYDYNRNCITFYLLSYKKFLELEAAKGDIKRQNELRKEIDTIAGHELGHTIIDSFIHEYNKKNFKLYEDNMAAYPRWLLYKGTKDEGQKLQESLSQVIGTYIATRIKDLPSDNESVVKDMMQMVYADSDRAVKFHSYINQNFDKLVMDVGIKELKRNGIGSGSTYEIRMAGLKRIEEDCISNEHFSIVYNMPRLGILIALASHSEEPLSTFIKNALENPAALGVSVRKYILDENHETESMDKKFNAAELKEKNGILEENFSGIARIVAAEGYLRYKIGYL